MPREALGEDELLPTRRCQIPQAEPEYRCSRTDAKDERRGRREDENYKSTPSNNSSNRVNEYVHGNVHACKSSHTKLDSQLEQVKIGSDLLYVLGRGRRYLLCSMSNWKPTLSRIRDSRVYPHPPLFLIRHYYLPPSFRADMLVLALEDTL